ncbi:hypothetical protein ACEPAI_3590 [Sanghuangporus weigelae]
MSAIDETRVKDAIQKLIDASGSGSVELVESLPTILIDFSSASVIASDQHKWNSWRTSVLMLGDVHTSSVVADPLELPASPSNSDWKEIEAILMTVKYPGKLRMLEALAYPEIEQQDYFIQDIIDWSRGVQALENKAYEIMQRTLVDTMLRWVFSERTSNQLKHTVCEEQDVLLPVNPNASVQVLQARADSFITRQLPTEVSIALGEAIASTTVSIKALKCVDRPSIHLGTFFGEWKREEEVEVACRQSAFYALGIQSQRKVLGLSNRRVYGLVLANGILYLVISYWTGDTMMTRYVPDLKWDIRRPSQLVECFYFLCALKEQIDKGFEQDVQDIKDKVSNGIIDLASLRTRHDNWERAGKSRTSARKSNREGSKGGSKVGSESKKRKLQKRGDDNDDDNHPGASGSGGAAGGHSGGPGGTSDYRRDDGSTSGGRDSGRREEPPPHDVDMSAPNDDAAETASWSTSTTNVASETYLQSDDGQSDDSLSDGKCLTREEVNEKVRGINSWRLGAASYVRWR